MIDSYLYDREGNPLPGAAPVALHVLGEPLASSAREKIARLFIDVATDYRLGLYGAFARRYIVDAQTTLVITVNQGVFKLLARVILSPDNDYYGGIVLSLKYVTNSAYYEDVLTFSSGRGGDAYPFQNILARPPEIAPSDKKTQMKRVAVPGILGTTSPSPTDTLIFQIARKGDLTKSPVMKGLVKIFRISSPLVGPIASHDFKGSRRYLVSAGYTNLTNSADSTIHTFTVGGFYLCGQRLNIPNTPEFPGSYVPNGTALGARLYTLGFRPASFERPVAAGFVVLAVDNLLYAYDMANASPTWQKLHEVAARGNEYGYTFTRETNSNGSLEITCSGQNAGGALSSFVVTRTKVMQGMYVTTGKINPASRNSQDSAPEVRAYNAQVGWQQFYTYLNDVSQEYLEKTVNHTVSGFFAEAEPRPDIDALFGGELNPARTRSTCSYTGSLDDALGTAATYTIQERPRFGVSPQQAPILGRTQNGSHSSQQTFVITNEGVGTIVYTQTVNTISTYTNSDYYYYVDAGGLMVDVTGRSTGSATTTESISCPKAGSIAPALSIKYAYIATDQFFKSLGWRRTFLRTGSWSEDLDGSALSLGTASVAMGSCVWGMELVDRKKAVRSDQMSFLSGFPSVRNAGPFTTKFKTFGEGNGGLLAQADANIYFEPGAGEANPRIHNFFSYLKHYDYFQEAMEGAPFGPFPDPKAAWAGSYSAQVNINGTEPITYTAVQYRALGDIGRPIGVPNWVGAAPLVVLNVELARTTKYQVSNVFPDTSVIDDRVHVDPRSNGFIAQLFEDARRSSGVGICARVASVLGNDDSVTSLVDVINEWIALTGEGATYDRIIIDRNITQEVSLI